MAKLQTLPANTLLMNTFLLTWELGYFGNYILKCLLKEDATERLQNEATDLAEMCIALGT